MFPYPYSTLAAFMQTPQILYQFTMAWIIPGSQEPPTCLSCPRDITAHLFCLNCLQPHWILCFFNSHSSSSALITCWPLFKKQMLKKFRFVVGQPLENIVQMLKLNKLLFELKSRSRRLTEMRTSSCLFVPSGETVSPSMFWQESHQTNEPTICKLTSWPQ